mgnify:CR=1 FL=1
MEDGTHGTNGGARPTSSSALAGKKIALGVISHRTLQVERPEEGEPITFRMRHADGSWRVTDGHPRKGDGSSVPLDTQVELWDGTPVNGVTELRERLTIHPSYALRPDPYLAAKMRARAWVIERLMCDFAVSIPELLGRFGLQRSSIRLSARNLFLWSEYSGISPETRSADRSDSITFGGDGDSEYSLLDILDHVLNAGVVVHGSVVISLGGVDLRDATLDTLRRRVVVIPQEGFLFNATIRDNVRIARDGASDAEVDAALDAVGAKDRFAALPEGLDTEVRERGSRLSAGEKQLVSLARAALADPAVLVLDEATSSLDPGTEALVEAAVDRLLEGRTVVVIAHRLTTAERADLVGVVADGHLAELGAHEDLVAAGGHYAALHRTWTAGLASSSP